MQMTQELSFSQQREIERKQRREAQANKLKQLQSAVTRGNIGASPVGSAIISKELVEKASKLIATKITNLTKSGASAAYTDEVKESLTLLSVSLQDEKNAAAGKALSVKNGEDNVYPLAAQIAQRALQQILSTAASCTGESVSILDDSITVYESQLASDMYRTIGNLIEQELRMISVMMVQPKLYYTALRYINNPAVNPEMTQLAIDCCIRGLNPQEQIDAWMSDQANYNLPDATEYAATSTDWTEDEKAQVANYVCKQLDATSEALPDAKYWESVRDKGTDTSIYMIMKDSYILDDAMEQEVVSTRSRRVMNMKPIMWMNGVMGGQVLNQELKMDPFIRKGQPDAEAGQAVYDTVNRLQGVGFIINDYILDAVNSVTEQLDKSNCVIGKYIAAVKGVHYSKSMKSKSSLMEANAQVGNVFYSYWNVDYRGRMYPINSTLMVQSTDFEKSLLRVADAQPVNENTEYWLCVHLANLYGMDKLSLRKRVEWVMDNIDTIATIAASPTEWLKYWADTEALAKAITRGDAPESARDKDAHTPDEPWQYLAACKEYADIFINKVKDNTNILVATDCTCSGLQIISGLTKDKMSATLVNVTGGPNSKDTDEKSDAYGAIGTEALKLIGDAVADEYKPLMTRSVAKKPVMTFAYNASPSKNTEQIREALRAEAKKGATLPEGDEYKQLVSAFGKAIRAAMTNMLPSVIDFKNWVNKCAAAAAADQKKLVWVTPSGFKVVQVKNEWETLTLKTALGGKTAKITIAVAETDEVQPNKHGTCTMPNLVHSLDASVLHVAYRSFDKPFALIHDSVMTTASDMSEAIDAYKESYVTHFGDGTYLESIVAALSPYENGKVVTPVATSVEAGGLDISEVRVSNYMLS